MIEEETRFERIRRQHLENLERYGYSSWMPIGHSYSDGIETITILRNPATGEVVSNA